MFIPLNATSSQTDFRFLTSQIKVEVSAFWTVKRGPVKDPAQCLERSVKGVTCWHSGRRSPECPGFLANFPDSLNEVPRQPDTPPLLPSPVTVSSGGHAGSVHLKWGLYTRSRTASLTPIRFGAGSATPGTRRASAGSPAPPRSAGWSEPRLLALLPGRCRGGEGEVRCARSLQGAARTRPHRARARAAMGAFGGSRWVMPARRRRA